jgi:hypothetical protein
VFGEYKKMIRLLLTLFCLILSYTASAAAANVMGCHGAKPTHSSQAYSLPIYSLNVDSSTGNASHVDHKSASFARELTAVGDGHVGDSPNVHLDSHNVHLATHNVHSYAATKADATPASGNCDCAMKCGCSHHCAGSCAATSALTATPAPQTAIHLAAAYRTNVPRLLIPPLFRPPIVALS